MLYHPSYLIQISLKAPGKNTREDVQRLNNSVMMLNRGCYSLKTTLLKKKQNKLTTTRTLIKMSLSPSRIKHFGRLKGSAMNYVTVRIL